MTGLEPETFPLPRECSTNWATLALLFCDSPFLHKHRIFLMVNSSFYLCSCGTLKIFLEMNGLEPITSCVQSKRSTNWTTSPKNTKMYLLFKRRQLDNVVCHFFSLSSSCGSRKEKRFFKNEPLFFFWNRTLKEEANIRTERFFRFEEEQKNTILQEEQE